MTLEQRNFPFLEFTPADTERMRCLGLVCRLVPWIPWQDEVQLWLGGQTSTWRKVLTASAGSGPAAGEEVLVSRFYTWILRVSASR